MNSTSYNKKKIRKDMGSQMSVKVETIIATKEKDINLPETLIACTKIVRKNNGNIVHDREKMQNRKSREEI